jgi:DHA2 family multidrug resistance protein
LALDFLYQYSCRYFLCISHTPFTKVAETKTEKLRIDAIGLGLLVLWIGALQLMLDLGHERDWFNSSSIIILALQLSLVLLFS